MILATAGHIDHGKTALVRDLRGLPIPVIGRIEANRVLLDLRCLEDEAAFLAQLSALSAS